MSEIDIVKERMVEMERQLLKGRIVEIIRAELKRQFAAGEIGWYAEGPDFVAVDGNPDLEKIADAIIKAGE
jgi:hypothetical protein